MTRSCAVMAVAGTLSCATGVAAQPGQLDTGFGRFGVASLDRALDFSGDAAFPPRAIQLTDLHTGPGGTFIAVGQLRESSDSGLSGDATASVVAVRYSSAGVVDHGFGDEGAFVDRSLGSRFPALTVDRNGRSHIAAWDGPRDSARALVMRLDSAGQLDSAYGDAGRVDLGPSLRPPEVALQRDGKLLVASSPPRAGGGVAPSVWRLLPDGSLDTTFGAGGATRFPAGHNPGHIAAIVAQPDGKIVVAGTASGADSRIDYFVARLYGDGTLDPTFGAGGTVQGRFRLPGGGGVALANEVSSLALQANGKVVIAGTVSTDASDSVPYNQTGPRPAVARYTVAGKPDRAFGRAGHVVTWLGQEAHVPDDGLLVQRGRVLVAAREGFGTTVIRYSDDGRRDATFGLRGLANVNLGAPEAIAGTRNGRFVVGAGDSMRCGFGLPVASFDGLQEPDVRVRGSATLAGRALRLRVDLAQGHRTATGTVRAFSEGAREKKPQTAYGRSCRGESQVGEKRIRVRGEATVVLKLTRKGARAARHTRELTVRVASSAGGREGETARRVGVRESK